jgi:DUF2934 family protein
MPTTQKAATKLAKPKAHRSARGVRKKPPGVPAPRPVPQFDSAAHHEEIAQAAYSKWLERPGFQEQDWLTAEAEVRARYR